MKTLTRGRALAAARIEGLQGAAILATEVAGRHPTLAIVAGADAASRKFVQIKRDALVKLDLTIETFWLGSTATTDEAIAVVQGLNQADGVDGVFLQFPLPAAIEAAAVADALALDKDIDCSSHRGMERLLEGASPFEPAAPAAARDLLRDALGELQDRRVVILGAVDVFAVGLRVLLEAEAAQCTVQARLEGGDPVDAIVVTDGFSAGALPAAVTTIGVLLDAGYYLPPRAEGWLPAELRNKIALHIPQYGNVGPLTVAYLAESTLTAARQP